MTQATGQECVISRVFSAPPELVYQAFVDPDQLAQWWGPERCSLRRETIEVIENELLVASMLVTGAPDHPGGVLRNTLRLEFHAEPGGKTRLELRQGPFTEQMAADVHDAWQESFTKLTGLL